MEKYKNKYRIPSTRWQNWDYGSEGMYFITICTKNRDHFFGEIENEQMIYSEIGKIANTEWLRTLDIRPDMNLEIGEFVVMPNHFHGIIMIGENKFNTKNDGLIANGGGNGGGIGDDGGNGIVGGRDAMHGVSTSYPLSLPNTPCPSPSSIPDPPWPSIVPLKPWTEKNTNKKKSQNKFGPQSKNIGSIIRGFKSSVTTNARLWNIEFDWQERFHDHVIRSHGEFLRISNYIKNNPKNWKEDKFHSRK